MPEPTTTTPVGGEGGSVHVVNEFGAVGTIPADQLDAAMASGDYRLAAPEEVEAEALQQEYGGVGGKVLAAATGALAGGTLGASDWALRQISEEAADEVARARAANPLLSVGAETVGALAGAGKFGGGGVARAAVRGATAPARGVIRAGEAIEAAAVGSRLAPVATVARGALEGAVFGAGQAVSEASLQNRELTAEKLASAALHGAALGGGIGAGVAGVGAVAKRGFSAIRGAVDDAVRAPGARAVEGLAEDAFGRASRGVGDKVVDAWDRASSVVAGTEPGAVRSMFQRTRSGKRGFEVALDAETQLAKSADELHARLDRVMKVRDRVQKRFSGELKADQVGKVIKKGAELEQIVNSRMLIEKHAAQLDDMIAREAEYGSRGHLQKLRKRLDAVDKKIEKAFVDADADAASKAFMQLDSFKRDVGKRLVKVTRRVQRGGTADEIATMHALDNMYEALRGGLENEAVWGGAAKMQRAMNGIWSEHIPANKKFQQLFSRWEDGRFGSRVYTPSREKIGAFVKGLSNPDKSEALAVLNEQLRTLDDFAQAARENMHLPPSEVAAIEELASELAGMRSALDDGVEAITLQNQLRALEQSGTEGALVGGAVGGALAGGPGGAVAGAALSGILQPGHAIKRLAGVKRLVQSVDDRVSDSLKKLARGAVPATTKAGARIGPGVSQYVQERRQELDERTTMARMFKAGGEQAFRRQAAEALAPVARGAPMMAQAAVDKLTATQSYLAAKLPDMGRRGPLGQAPELTDAEEQELLDITRAIDDPPELLEQVRSGLISSAAVEAVGETSPHWLIDLRTQVLDEVATLEAKGKTLPTQQLLALEVLLGVPTVPTQDPDVWALFAEAEAAGMPVGDTGETTIPGGKPPRRPITYASSYAHEDQRLEEEL